MSHINPHTSVFKTSSVLTKRESITKIDIDYLKKLLEFSRQHHEPFAAMLVDSVSGEILGYGRNRYPKNPIKHSEIDVYSNYSDKIGDIEKQSSNLTMYTTACPCPMCTAALVYSKIERVVYGVSRPFLEEFGFNEFIGLPSGYILQHAKHAEKISLMQIDNSDVVKEAESLFETYRHKYFPDSCTTPILAKL